MNVDNTLDDIQLDFNPRKPVFVNQQNNCLSSLQEDVHLVLIVHCMQVYRTGDVNITPGIVQRSNSIKFMCTL